MDKKKTKKTDVFADLPMEKDLSVDFGQPSTVEKAIKRNKVKSNKSVIISKKNDNQTN